MLIPFDSELAREAILSHFGEVVTKNGFTVKDINWGYSGQVPEYVIEGTINGFHFHWTKEGKRSLLSRENDYDLQYIIVKDEEDSPEV